MKDDKKLDFEPRQAPNWGLRPVTGRGWLICLIYLVVIAAPMLITTGRVTGGFLRHSSTMTLPQILALIWLLLGALVGIFYARYYLKKYYPKEK